MLAQPGSFDPGQLGIDENEFGADRLQHTDEFSVAGLPSSAHRTRTVDLRKAAHQTRSLTYGKEHPMEHDEKKADEKQQNEERDEMEDLDVSQQKAEDVRGGRTSLGDAARLDRRGQEMEHG